MRDRCRGCTHVKMRHNPTGQGLCRTPGCFCLGLDIRSDIEVEADMIVKMSAKFTGTEAVRWSITASLMRVWGAREPHSYVTNSPASFVATFLDMADALIAEGKVVLNAEA